MRVALTSSHGIVAHSASAIDANNVADIMDLICLINGSITQILGNPPLTLNTLEKSSSTTK